MLHQPALEIVVVHHKDGDAVGFHPDVQHLRMGQEPVQEGVGDRFGPLVLVSANSTSVECGLDTG